MGDRYRATIYVDLWAETDEEASKDLQRIVESLPNSYSDGISKLPHGSEISLDIQEP